MPSFELAFETNIYSSVTDSIDLPQKFERKYNSVQITCFLVFSRNTENVRILYQNLKNRKRGRNYYHNMFMNFIVICLQ